MPVVINHYPPVVKNIREIQQIARAEDKEFEKLKLRMDSVEKNMFVSTADETGVSRFEKMLGIIPKKIQTLEERKLTILAQMRQGKVSLGQLEAMLQDYSPGLRLLSHMEACELEVITKGDVINKGLIYKIVDGILPLDILFEVSRELSAGLHANLNATTEVYVNIGWGDE